MCILECKAWADPCNMQKSSCQALLLQVDYMGKAEFFGDVSVTKTPIAQTTAVAAGMTTILLVISK